MRLIKVDYSKRIYGLDVFRAVAILLVVLGHGGVIAGDIFSFIPSIPVIDGVELFFVLSGFLIGSIIINQVEVSEKLNFKGIFHFWKRRWLRTLPNYYLILLVNYFLVKYEIIGGDIHQFNYKFFLFIHNFSTGFYEFFWESWSLSVEEWFYIFLPILIALFLAILPKRKALIVTILCLLIFPLLHRISQSDMDVDKFWLDVNFRKVVIMRLDAIAFGLIAAYIKKYYSIFWYTSRNWMFILGIVIIYFEIFLPQDVNGFFTKTFAFSLTSFGAMLLLAKADSIKSFRYPVVGRAVTFISIISYSMYLVNLALVSQVIVHNFTLTTSSEHLLAYICYWAATIGISYLLYIAYERPFLRLRDRNRSPK